MKADHYSPIPMPDAERLHAIARVRGFVAAVRSLPPVGADRVIGEVRTNDIPITIRLSDLELLAGAQQ